MRCSSCVTHPLCDTALVWHSFSVTQSQCDKPEVQHMHLRNHCSVTPSKSDAIKVWCSKKVLTQQHLLRWWKKNFEDESKSDAFDAKSSKSWQQLTQKIDLERKFIGAEKRSKFFSTLLSFSSSRMFQLHRLINHLYSQNEQHCTAGETCEWLHV